MQYEAFLGEDELSVESGASVSQVRLTFSTIYHIGSTSLIPCRGFVFLWGCGSFWLGCFVLGLCCGGFCFAVWLLLVGCLLLVVCAVLPRQGMSQVSPSFHQGLIWESSEVTFHYSDHRCEQKNVKAGFERDVSIPLRFAC